MRVEEVAHVLSSPELPASAAEEVMQGTDQLRTVL